MANLNQIPDSEYQKLIEVTEESRDNISAVFDLIFDMGFLKPDDQMIEDKITKAHEALEEYKRLLKVSLEQVKQYQDQLKDDF